VGVISCTGDWRVCVCSGVDAASLYRVPLSPGGVATSTTLESLEALDATNDGMTLWCGIACAGTGVTGRGWFHHASVCVHVYMPREHPCMFRPVRSCTCLQLCWCARTRHVIASHCQAL
jgi:hypothetical protein